MDSPATSHDDPRIERTRLVVRRAALHELAVSGYGALTIEAVAARAGVAKSTIYRHWSGRTALLADALTHRPAQPPPDAADTPRDRVVVLLTHLAEAMADPDGSRIAPALVDAAERDSALAAAHHADNDRRRRALVDAVAAGVATGELPARCDPELTALALAGAVVYRRLMTDRPLPVTQVEPLVDAVLGDPECQSGIPSPEQGAPDGPQSGIPS